MNGLLGLAGPLVCGLLAASGLLYVAGVLWFATGLRRLRPGASRELPTVSIVVAARNEEAHIDRCLDGLRAQDYPRDLYEVIVVDDGSRDQTAAKVRAADDVRLLRTHAAPGGAGSKKAALSLGIQAASGQIILTTDADCAVEPGWIRALLAHFEPDVGMVVGFAQIGSPGGVQGLLAGYEAVDFLALMGCAGGSIGHGRPMAASGQNLGYRSQVFGDVGGYTGLMHRGSGDDVLLLQRVRRRRRWRIAFASEPAARVVHPPAACLAELLRKRIRWASNAPCQARLDPLFFLYMAAAYALNTLLVLSPVLCACGLLAPGWALGAWSGKWLAEGILQCRAMSAFGRRDLLRHLPAWLVVQPIHVALVGALGCLGVFEWKGARHLWGRRRATA